MRSTRTFLVAAIVLLIGLCILTSAVRADYILNGGEQNGTYRITNDGTFVGYFTPPDDVALGVESYAEDFALTPDLTTVYQFTNSLGFSDLIFAYESNSRGYLPGGLLHGGCCSIALKDQSIIHARMSLIRSNDPFGAGDLFTISENLGFPQLVAVPKIQRFDRETDLWVESILPPTSQHIYDFAFGPDNRLYMAAEDGIFVYEESPASHRFSLLSSTPLISDVSGTLTFGPDGKIYLRNVETGDVDRYSTLGAFIDTFIPAAEIPETGGSGVGDFGAPGRGSIQFGADGNLHLVIDNTYVGKYSGTVGELLTLVDAVADPDVEPFQLPVIGRVAYLPIPEPSTLLLGFMSAAFLASRRR